MSLALLLLPVLFSTACTPEPGDSGRTDGGSDAGETDGGASDTGARPGDTGSAWLPPAFTAPPDAVDTDPADDVVHVLLEARAHQHVLDTPDGPLVVDGWAYADLGAGSEVVGTPGPTIRARLGDTVRVTLTNTMDDETTIHWHGLDVPFEMDGVPWKTDTVGPGEQFTYDFVVEQAGTFWYHPHVDTERQVDLGLYGTIVVTDPAEPAVDHDLVAVLDDWTDGRGDTGWDPTTPAGAHGAHGDEGLWTVNGLVTPVLSLPAGESVRLRLVNASNTGYVDLSTEDDGGRLIALDQGLLPAAAPFDGVLLGSGDRAELLIPLGGDDSALLDHPYAHHGGVGVGDPAPLLTFAPDGDAAAPALPNLPFPGGDVAEDPGRTDLLYVFSGDTGTGDWYINGEQFPDVTIDGLEIGQEAVVEVRNLSPTDHPFHMHGHRFEVLSVDGEAPAVRLVEDTVNVGLYQRVRVRMLADNPGEWMVHCHLLPHAEGGMMTVLRVGPELPWPE